MGFVAQTLPKPVYASGCPSCSLGLFRELPPSAAGAALAPRFEVHVEPPQGQVPWAALKASDDLSGQDGPINASPASRHQVAALEHIHTTAPSAMRGQATSPIAGTQYLTHVVLVPRDKVHCTCPLRFFCLCCLLSLLSPREQRVKLRRIPHPYISFYCQQGALVLGRTTLSLLRYVYGHNISSPQRTRWCFKD